MTQNLPTVHDPYASHPDNLPAPVTGDPFQLARRTPVGRIVLAEDSTFLQMALAAGLNPAAMALELASAASRNQDILRCTPASMQSFMLDAGKLGLTIGRGVYPVPIPHKKGTPDEEWRLEAWVGYKGAKQLAMESGAIKDCWAVVVFDGDEFEDTLVPIPQVTKHRYGPNKGAMAKAIKVYAVLLYPGGRTRMKVFDRAKIESYRKLNPTNTWKSSPWVRNEEEMWMAKAILHSVGDLPHKSEKLAHLAAMVEREELAAAAPVAALPADLEIPQDDEPTPIEGPNTDEGPEDLGMSLEDALAVRVQGKHEQPQTLAQMRNSGLQAWLDWARGKLDAEPDNPRLVKIATACRTVLEARAAGVIEEPAKAEAAA